MGIERITKKLVPQLQDIDGAILILNSIDPQFATFSLFMEAVSHLPNFVVVNKVDMISDTDALELASKFSGKQVILASIKTGRGIDEIKARLAEGFEGKVLVAGVFNAGKTSLINALTGEHNPVDDIPGTTLVFSHHPYGSLILVDSVGQIIDISKPLMVSIDLTRCTTIEDRLLQCLNEDIEGIKLSVNSALPGLMQAIEIILKQVNSGHKVVTCGAGASALVAMEIAGQAQETGLPVMVFTNNLSDCQPVAFAKGIGEIEFGLAEYFSRAVQEGDVAIAISASGGTGFVFTFLELVRKKGAITIAITENRDTPLGKAADIVIKSEAKPEGPSSSKIQIAHLAIGHALILTLADLRGVTAENSIGFMLPKITRSKKVGIK